MSLALTTQWHDSIQSGLIFLGRIGKFGLMAQSQQINSRRFTYRTSLFTFGMFGTHLLAEVWILYQSLQRLDLVKSEIIDLMVRMYILQLSMLQSIAVRRSRRNTVISESENDNEITPVPSRKRPRVIATGSSAPTDVDNDDLINVSSPTHKAMMLLDLELIKEP